MSLAILGFGARTAVGLDAAATAAAVRAGIGGQAEHPFMLDRTGEPMVVARVPAAAGDLEVAPRLVELALGAALEALEGAPEDREMHLAVALPEPRPGLPKDCARAFEAALLEGLATHVPSPASCLVAPAGPAGGLALLADAYRVVRDRPGALVLVGGADSYMAPETLEWLDAQELLHSLAMPWGLCPGEAAGFCLVGAADAGGARLHVLSLGTGRELNPIRTGAVCLAEGLSAAWRKAIAGAALTERAVTAVVCDLNGEPYRADEYGFTMLRHGRFVAEDAAFFTPAECWGDVGAAFGPLSIVLAAEAVRRAYAAGPVTLVSAGSDSGRRAALVLRAPQRS